MFAKYPAKVFRFNHTFLLHKKLSSCTWRYSGPAWFPLRSKRMLLIRGIVLCDHVPVGFPARVYVCVGVSHRVVHLLSPQFIKAISTQLPFRLPPRLCAEVRLYREISTRTNAQFLGKMQETQRFIIRHNRAWQGTSSERQGWVQTLRLLSRRVTDNCFLFGRDEQKLVTLPHGYFEY